MVLSSLVMESSEGIGFGTQLTLDGASADAHALAAPATARELLSGLLALVEEHDSGAEDRPLVNECADGLSAALIRGETSVTLHTFPELRAVSLQIFTAHDLPLGSATKLFLAAYRVGRFQSNVRDRGLYLPRNAEKLSGALDGLRDYSRLRVAPGAPVRL